MQNDFDKVLNQPARVNPTHQNNFLKLAKQYDKDLFVTLHEEMSFAEYIDAVYCYPRLIRTAYQRIYDMIMSEGVTDSKRYRKTITHYNFFDNADVPIYGLEETLECLVKFIRGAAGGYGTEKRVLLLHGPVGSAKSTICRLLKRGLESYSRKDDGRWYTFKWIDLPTGQDGIYLRAEDEDPMNEDPIKLIPYELRKKLLQEVNQVLREQVSEAEGVNLYTLRSEGELNPRSKRFMSELLRRYDGDWQKVCEKHIRVIRKVYSEADREGIATFQPKDEKNQDSTELTGDIDYSKLPHFGSDSDPRAFNFDGEFCKGNRGVVEFIEMLKLAKEFLYDLLGASQEQQIKPKKFPQISVDLALIGHSVHCNTQIPYLYRGILDVAPISELVNCEIGDLYVFSVNMETNDVELTPVKNVFSHDFGGEWVCNHQDGDELITTPNHSVYKSTDGGYEKFYPGEDTTSEIATVKLPVNVVLNYPKTERWEKFFSE
jgi:serine protein kinase